MCLVASDGPNTTMASLSMALWNRTADSIWQGKDSHEMEENLMLLFWRIGMTLEMYIIYMV